MAQHTVRTFDRELEALGARIQEMGLRAEHQYAVAVDALLHRDPEQAGRAVASDSRLDADERDISETALRLLALRQPVAVDFREAIAAVKIASDLERVGDLAKDLAKRATAIQGLPSPPERLRQMTDRVAHHLHEVVNAYGDRDAAHAVEVWAADCEVDDDFYRLYRALLDLMLKNPETIGTCTHLLFAAKNVERIGDHCANIADSIYYLAEGTPIPAQRPKGRDASLGEQSAHAGA